jgi:hypothetical protein
VRVNSRPRQIPDAAPLMEATFDGPCTHVAGATSLRAKGNEYEKCICCFLFPDIDNHNSRGCPRWNRTRPSEAVGRPATAENPSADKTALAVFPAHFNIFANDEIGGALSGACQPPPAHMRRLACTRGSTVLANVWCGRYGIVCCRNTTDRNGLAADPNPHWP